MQYPVPYRDSYVKVCRIMAVGSVIFLFSIVCCCSFVSFQIFELWNISLSTSYCIRITQHTVMKRYS